MFIKSTKLARSRMLPACRLCLTQGQPEIPLPLFRNPHSALPCPPDQPRETKWNEVERFCKCILTPPAEGETEWHGVKRF
jgi:hypothetical protein